MGWPCPDLILGFEASDCGVGAQTSDKSRRSDDRPRPRCVTALDRIAVAVDGVESSHGTDPKMRSGPTGRGDISAAAVEDAGGGNRFLRQQNRAIAAPWRRGRVTQLA
jgi:hypothetical protein